MAGFAFSAREIWAGSPVKESLSLAHEILRVFLRDGAYRDVEYAGIRLPLVDLVNGVDS